MNNILRESLINDTQRMVSAVSLESYTLKIHETVEQLNDTFDLLKYHDKQRARASRLGAISLEAEDTQRASILERIKELIRKIIAFAGQLFERIKGYIENFLSSGEQNKRSLKETQLLINRAKQKQDGVAMEGYATGTIPLQAPKFLHMEFSKIVSETHKLETLAASYIKDTIALLTLQFMHCKHVIEAYNRLMTGQFDLENFEHVCARSVQEGINRFRDFNTNHVAFDCIAIQEEEQGNDYAGVLRYRATIKAPGKDEMVTEELRITTNLMKAQDLQDRLTALNDEIVRYAKDIKEFFVNNSKIFLDTLNKLNDSALTSKDGKFTAHSDYVTNVHSFLVRGNLIQVVVGLNVLNTVWKAVHNLNNRVVKEFLNT